MRLYGGNADYRVGSDTMGALVKESWPGNIRQLENAVYRATVLAPQGSELLRREDLLPASDRPVSAADTENTVLAYATKCSMALDKVHEAIVRAILESPNLIQVREDLQRASGAKKDTVLRRISDLCQGGLLRAGYSGGRGPKNTAYSLNESLTRCLNRTPPPPQVFQEIGIKSPGKATTLEQYCSILQSRPFSCVDLSVIVGEHLAPSLEEVYGERDGVFRDRELMGLREGRDQPPQETQAEPAAEGQDIPMGVVQPEVVTGRLRDFPALALIGPPCCGKTTIVKHITLMLARQDSEFLQRTGLREGYLPIPISLSGYFDAYTRSGRGLSIIDYISQFFSKYDIEPADLKETIAQKVLQGQTFFLLDGLDEVPERRARNELVGLIDSLVGNCHRQHRGNRFIVTSRPTQYAETSVASISPGAEVTLGPLTDPQISSFVKRWYSAPSTRPRSMEGRARDADALIRGLQETIDSDVKLRRFARSPLYLSAMAYRYEVGATLPTHRILYYKDCADSLVSNWRMARTLDQHPLDPVRARSDAVAVVSALAYWMHGGQDRDFTRDAVLNKVAEIMREEGIRTDSPREDAEVFLAVLEEQEAVLVYDQQVLSFVLPAFEEYFAALYLADHDVEASECIRANLHHSDWEDVFLLLAAQLATVQGDSDAATDLVKFILEVHPEDKVDEFLWRHVLFAARILGEDIWIEGEVAGSIIKSVIRLTASVSDDALEERAWSVLARLKGSMYYEYLTGMLLRFLETRSLSRLWVGVAIVVNDMPVRKMPSALVSEDADGDLNWQAKKALAKFGTIEAVRILWPYVKDKDRYPLPDVLPAGTGALHDPKEIVNFFVQQMRDGQETVRDNAAAVLAALSDRKAVAALRDARRNSTDELSRWAATLGLAGLGDEDGASTLRKVMAAEPKSERASVAEQALARAAFGDGLSLLPSRSKEIPPKEQPFNGSVESIPTLREALKKRRHWKLGTSAVQVLRCIEGEEATQLLVEAAMTHEGIDTRASALEALQGRDPTTVIRASQDALSDSSKWVREQALKCLQAVGERAVATLKDAVMQNTHADVRVQAARTLGILGDRSVSDALERVVHDNDAEVGHEAAVALVRLRGETFGA